MAIAHRLNRVNTAMKLRGYFDSDISEWNNNESKEDFHLLFIGWDPEIADNKKAIIDKYKKQYSMGLLTPIERDLHIEAELKHWNIQ